MRKLFAIAALVMALFSAVSLQAKTLEVKSGQSIQAAVTKAVSGDTVEVEPGIYAEAVVVEKPGIRLIGRVRDGKWPVLDGEKKRHDGVIASGSKFEMAYFQVKNYTGNGVMSQGADDVFFHHLVVSDTGIYGIYPTRGKRVRVEDTLTWGIADAGIYVGMCESTDVRRNEVFKNVAGIEIENSSHVIVEDNIAHDNTAGILVFTLPGLPVKSGRDVIVRRNLIYDNNLENFGAPGSVVGDVPPGSGMILLAADQTVIENNLIRGHRTAGLIFSDMSYLSGTSPKDPEVDPQFDDNKVLNNFFFDNGSKPDAKVKMLLLVKEFTLRGGDVVANGRGRRNCVSKDLQGRFLGLKEFSPCASDASTASVLTMLGQSVPETGPAKPANLGRDSFNNVCAGCHGRGIRLIGPPLEEIQKKYAGNSAGIAAFAAAPKKVREGYPAMPAQTHISRETLLKTAEYILSLQ